MLEEQKNQTKKPAETIVHPFKLFVFELILFSLGLVLGVVSGFQLRKLFNLQKISLPPVSMWQFIAWFSLGTLFILFLVYFLKFKKSRHLFFKGIFLLAVILGNLSFFDIWLGSVSSLLLVACLVIIWLKKDFLIIHNLVLLFAVAGIGATLGLRLEPKIVVLLLLVFSIYDYIAVYKTKHMVKIAKTMIEEKAIIGIVIPQKLSDFRSNLDVVKPGGQFLILGAGDIIFPLVLAVSVIPQGIGHSLVVSIFAVFGLFAGFLIFIFQKKRKPMPALPSIALFSIIGYLLMELL
jgi:presenilin-like A22 family membrane protease